MTTNALGLPEPFVNAVSRRHEYVSGRYSVTDVLGGTCEAILKRRHSGDVEEDVSDQVWALLGTAVHRVLQDAEATDTQLQENWLSAPIPGCDGYSLSGIFDLYDDSTGTVTDYKTTSVYTVMFGDFEKWRMQTLLYCWLLRQNGFDAHRGEIVAILRDHSQRKARTERDYPRHPVFTIGWDFTEEDIDGATGYLVSWFTELMSQELVGDDRLEPCPDDKRWHKPDKWAVMRVGKKKAIRLFDTEDDADEYMEQLTDRHGACYRMEHRPGEDTRCDSYCSVADFCPYVHRLRDATGNADENPLSLAT